MNRREKFKRKIHNQPKTKFDLFNFFKNVNNYKYLSIFLIILFILSIPAVVKRLIKIDKIECKSQFGLCANSYQLGDYNFVKTQIENDLNNDVQVDSYLIQYKIPSTIKIDLVSKRTKFVIKNLSNQYYYVDKDGLVLDILDTSELSFLINNSNYSIGQKISERDNFALNLIEKLSIINTIYSSEIVNQFLETKIENGILVKFPLEGDMDVLIGSLRLIFSRLNENENGIRMEDVREIDLRFKNPIIR